MISSLFTSTSTISSTHSTNLNANSTNSSNNKSHTSTSALNLSSFRVETLHWNTRWDVEHALQGITKPKRVVIAAHLLANSTTSNTSSSSNDGIPLTRALKQVGCLQLVIQGKSARAPRRVYEHEIVALLASVKASRLYSLTLENLDIQRQLQLGVAPAAATAAAAANTADLHVKLLKDRLRQFHVLEQLHIQSCRLGDTPTTTTPTPTLTTTTNTNTNTNTTSMLEDLLQVMQTGLPNLQQVTLQLCNYQWEGIETFTADDDGTDVTGDGNHGTTTGDGHNHNQEKRRLVETMTHIVSRKKNNNCSNNIVKALAISDFPTQPLFWGAIADSTTLEHLTLTLQNHYHYDMDMHMNMYAINHDYCWKMLQQNTSIQQLELYITGGSPPPPPSLSTPGPIETVNNNTNNNITNPLVQYIRDNTSLTTLILHVQPNDPQLPCLTSALAHVLEHFNFTLQTVRIVCQNIFYGYTVRIPCPQIDFYTKLNRQGRQTLVRGGSGTSSTTCPLMMCATIPTSTKATGSITRSLSSIFQQHHGNHPKPSATAITATSVTCGVGTAAHDALWIDTMASNNYDLSMLYYWLHANPNLFNSYHNVTGDKDKDNDHDCSTATVALAAATRNNRKNSKANPNQHKLPPPASLKYLHPIHHFGSILAAA